jgi:RNA polymerase sigma-70 factor (ECF subfamily)
MTTDPGADDRPPGPATPSSLLQRIGEGAPGAYARLVNLYAPVVARWCRRAGLPAADVDDVLQEVFRAVVRTVADFRRDRASGSFHAWLFTITRNKIRDLQRRQGREPAAVGGSDFQRRLEQESAVEDDASTGSGDATDPQSLLRRCLDLVRVEFEEKTWQAFWRAVIDEQETSEIARDLGMSANAVRLAKSRVLRRLRLELRDLIEMSDDRTGDGAESRDMRPRSPDSGG